MKTKLAVRMVSTGNCVPSETNPRRKFLKHPLEGLKRSIEKEGIRQNLTVRKIKEGENKGKFEIIAGERRWKCAVALGMPEVPVSEVDWSDREVRVFQFAENHQREDLTALEEADAILGMRDLGMSRDEIVAEAGVSRQWVQLRMHLGDLPAVARRALDSGKLGIVAANHILKVDEDAREKFVQDALDLGEEMTEARMKEVIEERYVRPREDKEAWKDYWEKSLKTDLGDIADAIDDPARWAEYLRPYGEGHGKWKAASETIGGLAARKADRGITWGKLAVIHGVRGIAMPCGRISGQDDIGSITKVVVDRSAIEDCERALRKAKQPYTIGTSVPDSKPPKEEGKEEKEDEPEADEEETPEAPEVETPAVAASTLSRLEEMKLEQWSPWVIPEELEERHAIAAHVAVAVLDIESPDWDKIAALHLGYLGRAQMSPDVHSILHVAIWWVLRDESISSASANRFARFTGVYELWKERGAK